MVYFRLKNIDYTFEIQISNLKDFVFKRIEWNPLPNRSALELKNPNLDVVIQSIIFSIRLHQENRFCSRIIVEENIQSAFSVPEDLLMAFSTLDKTPTSKDNNAEN